MLYLFIEDTKSGYSLLNKIFRFAIPDICIIDRFDTEGNIRKLKDICSDLTCKLTDSDTIYLAIDYDITGSNNLDLVEIIASYIKRTSNASIVYQPYACFEQLFILHQRIDLILGTYIDVSSRYINICKG